MLKACLMASAASALLVGTALAADLPSRRAPPAYIPPPIPAFTWTGFYVGGNAGYAGSNGNAIETFANDPVTASQLTVGTVSPAFELHQGGFAGGGQIGYNYELPGGSFGGLDGLAGGGLVVGVEADAAYTDLRRDGQFAGAFQVNSNYHQSLDYLGTVRGRVGFAVDQALIYATGGFAYGQTSTGQSIVAGNANNLVIWSGTRSGMQTGYAVGGGVEYALPTTFNVFNSSAVTVKIEYLYYDLGTKAFNLVGGAGAPFTFTDQAQTSGNLVRAGLNFKFGDAAPVPVVARY